MPKPINTAEIKKRLKELKKERERAKERNAEESTLGNKEERDMLIKTLRGLHGNPNFEKISGEARAWLLGLPYKQQIYILRAIGKANPEEIERIRRLPIDAQKRELKEMGDVEELEEIF